MEPHVHRPDRVPVVIATLLREAGGTGLQTHFGELARHLADRDLPVALVTPFSAGGVLRDAVFAVRRAIDPLSRTLAVLWYIEFHRRYLELALRRRLRHIENAVVYCQCPTSALAAVRARGRGVHRVVLAVHFCTSQADEWAGKGAIPSGGRAYRAIRRMERRVFGQVDGVVFVSEVARAQLWMELSADVPTVTIPNFLSSSIASAPARSAADLVTVGVLERHKNQAFLLDVLAAAARRGHRFTLDVIGEGPERRSLTGRARQLGLDGQVRFLGYVPEARQMLAGYRAYAHAATRESFGLAVLEAMASGLPVFAAPAGGPARLFDDGVEGRVWSVDDPEKAAQVLIEVLTDELTRAELGARARQRFLRQFDAAVVGPALHEFLVRVPRRTEVLDGGVPARSASSPEPAIPATETISDAPPSAQTPTSPCSAGDRT